MQLNKEDARRVLCDSHGFDGLKRGEGAVMDSFEDIPCIQVDPINSAGRNHDLTLFSRIEDYRHEHLTSLLYEENQLFEYYCKMLSILPIEYYPVFKAEMKRQADKHKDLFQEYEDEIDLILKRMEEKPISSLELEEMGDVIESSWRSKKLSHRLLRALWLSGEVFIHHREGRRKYYTPADNVVPDGLHSKETFDEDEYRKKVAGIIVKSSKLVSPAKASAQWKNVGGVRETRKILNELEEEKKIFSLEVEGWDGKLYAPEDERYRWEDIADLKKQYVRFLAPLDPLLWNRELFASIFEHEYVWEVYKKKEDRIYGHYCLPILFNDEYIGLIEPYQDGDVLEIRNLHLFDDISEDEVFLELLKKELERFMDFLGVDEIEDKSDHVSLNKILLK